MDALFRSMLRHVVEDGRERASSTNPYSPHSRFGAGGGGLLEARAVRETVRGPFVVALASATRNASLARSLGMAAWNLRGDDSLDAILPYNPNAARFCDDLDAATLRAPWGRRLIGASWSTSVLWRALRELEADPDSLRCCAPVYLPRDVGARSRDVPCLLALDLALVDGELHVTALLRALNAFGVLPHDHCLLACICEALRAHLGVAAVALTYVVCSLHVTAGELARARAALSEPVRPPAADALRFRDGDLRAAVEELRALEPRLRAALAGGDAARIEAAHADVVERGSTWAVDLLGALCDARLHELSTATPARG